MSKTETYEEWAKTLFTKEPANMKLSACGADPEVLVQSRLEKGKERLNNAIESLALLCEPVEPPKGELQYIHYFCGNSEIAADLKEREPQRSALYKSTVASIRAYANLSDELESAGYGPADIDEAVKRDRPDGWRGIRAREQVVKRALYDILQNSAEVERIFLIIKAQNEY